MRLAAVLVVATVATVAGSAGAVPLSSAGSNRTVVLLGDSLINHPWQQFNLSSKLDAMVRPVVFVTL